MSGAGDRLRQYVAGRDSMPLRGLDDVVHEIHTGTEHHGELRLSDLRELLAADADLVDAAKGARDVLNGLERLGYVPPATARRAHRRLQEALARAGAAP